MSFSVEHKLHYGICEIPLYELNRFWGNLDNLQQYIDFLYSFSTSDFFNLAQGDIVHHLEHRATNVYEFFFELMDEYTLKNKKKFWVTKFDPLFFADGKERIRFLSCLSTRYTNVKNIIIKRNLKESLTSYLRMEGARYVERQKAYNTLPALLLQTARYYNVYTFSLRVLPHEKFSISFDEFVHQQNIIVERIADFII